MRRDREVDGEVEEGQSEEGQSERDGEVEEGQSELEQEESVVEAVSMDSFMINRDTQGGSVCAMP